MTRRTLVVIPALAAHPGLRGEFGLTRKFLDGALEYARRWPGEMAVCIEPATCENSNLDQIEVKPCDVPFGLKWISGAPADIASHIRGAKLVLASLVDKHVHLPEICRALHVPLVYVAEYSVRTRRQIIRSETRNPLLRWRRELWTTQLERKFEDCVRQADGVQCNGTPTHEAYRGLNRRALLFFDTRIRRHQVVSTEILNERTAEMMAGAPLRLLFSGRLIPMKGADHLPMVAAELKRLGVKFSMHICGDGELRPALQRAIERMHLADCVTMPGVLDFQTALVPFVSRQADLFVCCHRQGDPSCTYLETMSCGTPIVGYDNDAFHGLAARSGVGWTTPMDQPRLLARRIAELDRQRPVLAHAAFAARHFAERHTFEKTMEIRMDHMLACDQPLHMEAKAS